jgi:hypothetical protein
LLLVANALCPFPVILPTGTAAAVGGARPDPEKKEKAMTTETAVEASLAATTEGYRVTVTGIVEDTPALLGFYSILTMANGTHRRIPQVVRVLDETLLQRLRAEVCPGEEIRVVTALDKGVPDCPTVLLGFSKAP